MARELEGRSVIITGGASGIGGACARLFATQGAQLTLVDRDEGKLAALAAQLGANVLPLRLDVSVEADMAEMATRAKARFGGIDALVAAAGIRSTSGEPKPVIDLSYEEWRRIVEVVLRRPALSLALAVAAIFPHALSYIQIFRILIVFQETIELHRRHP